MRSAERNRHGGCRRWARAPTRLFIDGRVYLTGPYEGAPFGLSIVVPAKAGPFNLGTIVLGARIDVDPSTAALTITSGPLPQQLDGIPLQLKTINLDIDREGFMFNPTDCRPPGDRRRAPEHRRRHRGRVIALPGGQLRDAAVQAEADSADARPRRAKRTAPTCTCRVVSAPGQANLAKIKVDLPKQLVSRLTTLQHACAAAVIRRRPGELPARRRSWAA